MDNHCSEIGADSSLSKCCREAGYLESQSTVCLGILETEAGAMAKENQSRPSLVFWTLTTASAGVSLGMVASGLAPLLGGFGDRRE